jgi:hypothetical protein
VAAFSFLRTGMEIERDEQTSGGSFRPARDDGGFAAGNGIGGLRQGQ